MVLGRFGHGPLRSSTDASVKVVIWHRSRCEIARVIVVIGSGGVEVRHACTTSLLLETTLGILELGGRRPRIAGVLVTSSADVLIGHFPG